MKKFLNRFLFYRSQFTQIAFTLAETLIVIGILGVVAALTLPNLNHATGDKEIVTRVKKINSSLTEALDRAEVTYGSMDEWFRNDTTNAQRTERLAKRVVEFMKVSKDCGLAKGETCFKNTYKYLNPSKDSDYSTVGNSEDIYKVLLSDGTSLGFNFIGVATGYWCIYFYVDIDGPNKGASTKGKDLFQFQIMNYGAQPFILTPLHGYFTPDGLSSFLFNQGVDSAAWILQFDNADYLKASSTGLCPDGKTLLDGVTNTSCH